MRNVIKLVSYFSAYGLHLVGSLFSNTKQEGISVLMYHAVNDGGWRLSVTPRLFEKQMEYLASRYKVVRLSDVLLHIEGSKPLPPSGVAITIDDGYEDTYTTVFPIMKKRNLPFTVFLTTDLRQSSKFAHVPRIQWKQVKEMYESGLVSFEVHGHAHENLVTLSGDEAALDREVVGCRDEIQSHLSYRSAAIAYASGYKNAAVVSYLKQRGFRAGFTINEGRVRSGDNPFYVKRTQVDGTMSFLLFRLRLTGAVEMHRAMIDRIRALYGKK